MTAATRQSTILPEEARRVLVSAFAAPAGAVEATDDGLIEGAVPVLVRGDARIVPLAEWHSAGTPADAEELWHSLSAACQYRAGNWSLLDLDAERDDAIGDYTAALRAVGATRVRYWIYPDGVGVALVRAGDGSPEATLSLALHLVPDGWVFHRSPGPSQDVPDLRWSWGDVNALSADDRGLSL